MQKKYAFILMGPAFDPGLHRACFSLGETENHIRTARSFEEAKSLVTELHRAGFGVIELCGAFGEARARELIELTKGEVGIGFVSHLPFQDAHFDRFFGR